MNDEETWTVIRQHRCAVADFLAGLRQDQWDAASLCAGWSVRDVAAHLTIISVPPPASSLLADLARARGSMHRLNTVVTKRRAQTAPDALVDLLRTGAASRKLPAVTDKRNVLFDLLVHGMDMSIPLGLDLPVPPAAAAEGATRVWEMGWPFWAKRRLKRLHLVATDVEWSVGDVSGPQVRGPIAAHLLLLTGRSSAAAPLLTGDGVAAAGLCQR